jgi:hypothetical protein
MSMIASSTILYVRHSPLMIQIDNKPQTWPATTKWEQKLNEFLWTLDDGLPRFRHQVCRVNLASTLDSAVVYRLT